MSIQNGRTFKPWYVKHEVCKEEIISYALQYALEGDHMPSLLLFVSDFSFSTMYHLLPTH